METTPVEFSINIKGKFTGEEYKGTFKVKPMLTHRDRLYMDQKRRELLGNSKEEVAGRGAISNALVFAYIWTHLLPDVKSAPGWWTDAGDGLDLYDFEPVEAVYNEIVRIENEAVEKIKDKAKDAEEELKVSKKNRE